MEELVSSNSEIITVIYNFFRNGCRLLCDMSFIVFFSVDVHDLVEKKFFSFMFPKSFALTYQTSCPDNILASTV